MLALLQPDAVITADALDEVIATGQVPQERRASLIGASLNDLVRRAYAEIEMPSGEAGPEAAEFTLAAPHVSWFAGVLGAVEIVKQLRALPLVDRRVDVDLLGLPQGVTRRMPADATGRCVCHGRRADWYRQLYG